MYCAAFPMNLVHLVDGKGIPIHDAGVTISLGDLHAIHIFAGGAATVVIAMTLLVEACTKVHSD